MSDWINTKAGLQMAETITRKLPRIANSLEEIAISLNYLRRLENNERKIEMKDKLWKGYDNGM